jgi:hypothetical protein
MTQVYLMPKVFIVAILVSSDRKLIVSKGKMTSMIMTPNVMVEWLKFLLYIRKIPGSNLGLETGYRTEIFRCFPLSLQANASIVP